MGYALLQHTNNFLADADRDILIWPRPLTPGSLLVAAADSGSTVTAVTVDDGGTNTWRQIGALLGPNGDSQVFGMFYAWNNRGSGQPTVIFSYTGGKGNSVYIIAEFVGVGNGDDPLAGFNILKSGTTATGANAVTSNAATPTAPGCLAVAAVSDTAGTTPTVTVGTGWLLADNTAGGSTTTGSLNLEWQALTGAPSTTATWTMNIAGNNYQAGIAFFQPQPEASSGFRYAGGIAC